MPDENLVRYLAPAALVVAALAILITWQTSVGGDAPPEPAGQDQPAETREEGEGEDGGGEDGEDEGGGDPQAGGDPEAGEDAEGEGAGEVYTVQAGDTLSIIETETGVDVETLMELNPDANPQALQAGDELELGP